MKIINKLPARSRQTIVQQTNTISTRQVFKDFFAGKPLNIPAGSDQRSFDFDDQTKVDFDAPRIKEAENLIDQHFMRERFMEHLHPTPPQPQDPVDPAPAPEFISPTPQE